MNLTVLNIIYSGYLGIMLAEQADLLAPKKISLA